MHQSDTLNFRVHFRDPFTAEDCNMNDPEILVHIGYACAFIAAAIIIVFTLASARGENA